MSEKSKLTSVPKKGKFTLGKFYEILESELWSSRYAEFKVADDEGIEQWLCCAHFNDVGINPETCPCCQPAAKIDPPTIQFLGVGGAFAPISKGNSNMLIKSNGQYMLIDCGGSVQYTLKDEFGVDPRDIDALWISHLHADHIGSMEWFAFYRHFLPKKGILGAVIKPKLYMVNTLMDELWENSLKGGLQSVEGKVMHLTNYFECIPVTGNTTFEWQGLTMTPVQTIHVMSGYIFKESYGLLIKNNGTGKTTFVTTDTQFSPYQLRAFYDKADQIFHDCETIEFKSNVHAHYTDLKTLSPEVRGKMWLYHYANKIDTVLADGFRGFVDKGQKFDL